MPPTRTSAAFLTLRTVMLSVVCAITCSQAEFTFPPFENDQKLQGTELCLSAADALSAGSIWGGPRLLVRCICGDMCVEAPFVCRVLPCTSDATARDVLGGSA